MLRVEAENPGLPRFSLFQSEHPFQSVSGRNFLWSAGGPFFYPVQETGFAPDLMAHLQTTSQYRCPGVNVLFCSVLFTTQRDAEFDDIPCSSLTLYELIRTIM